MENFRYFLTWIPAFAFPLSHIVQINKMISSGQVKDVSAKTFYGYFLGNLGAYLFTEKYTDLRTIFAYLLTAFLEIIIVSMVDLGTDDKIWFSLTILTTIIFSIYAYYAINYQQKYLKSIASYAGYLPAVMFPFATIFQIWRIVNTGQLHGVSYKAWILQILANVGAYFLTDKLLNPKSIMAFLLTAILDLMIVIIYFVYA